MESTISNNRQFFNVKTIADAGLTVGKIPSGALGFIDVTTGLTVKPTNFKQLPDEFQLVGNTGDDFYFSITNLLKERLYNKISREYQAEQPEKWKGIIQSCDCTKTVKLTINIEEDSLIRMKGLSWTDRDMFVEVAPKEFSCYCDCTGKGVYENNVMTMLLYKKILESDSPFYTAEVYKEGGDKLDGLDAVKAFIESNKEVNTDDVDSNDGEKLELHIIGKVIPAKHWGCYDRGRVYPRGVRLYPTIEVNGEVNKMFEKTQALKVEIGNGSDLREAEWCNMNNYTNLYYQHYDSTDGFVSDDVKYQFENDKTYDVVALEAETEKSRIGVDNWRRVLYTFGSEHGNGVFAELKKIFDIK